MFFKTYKLIYSLAATSLILSSFQMFADSPSTWTGDFSSQIRDPSNWDNGVPYSGIAIFDGNGVNSPISNQDSGLNLAEMQFTSSTDVSVITSLDTSDPTGVITSPGVTANFEIYEHQPLFYPPASLRINNGYAGEGGGTVVYNLESYGQLYAYSGSADATIINVFMTEGNNYFEVNGPESNIFDNITSDTENDEIYISTGSNLTIRGTDTNTIEGVISGDGSLTKTGTGVLILNNDNTYTGETLVSEGTLEINGSLSSNLTVDAKATVKGNGIINGDLLLSGTISPGNSIGILTVENYISTGSSVFSAEVNSLGDSDQIIATNSMTLAGTLEIIPLDVAFSSPQTYELLQAGTGISGTFSNIQSAVPALMALTYGADGVSLTYLPLSAIGLNGSEAAAANCFISVPGSDANTVSAELLSLSFQEMQNAFNQMLPSQFSAQTWTQLASTLLVRSSHSKHVRDFSLQKGCLLESSSNFWIDGLGEWQNQNAKDNQLGFTDWTAGVSMGADTSYKQFRFGGALSYTYSKVYLDESAGNSQINGYYGGFYGGWGNEIGYLTFSTLGSYNQFNSTRNLSFGSIDRSAQGSHHGWEVLTGIELGAAFTAKQFKIGPFGRFDYVYLWQQGYQENGANSLNLYVESRQDQLIQSQAGIALTTRYDCNPDRKYGTFTPRLELSYINQTPVGSSDYEASFNNNCEFSSSGWDFERNLGAIGAALTYLTASGKFGVSLQYDGQFGNGYSSQSGNLIFDIKY